jgi:hypothetical protein
VLWLCCKIFLSLKGTFWPQISHKVFLQSFTSLNLMIYVLFLCYSLYKRLI